MPYIRAQRVIGNFRPTGPWNGDSFYQRTAGSWSTQGVTQREGAAAVSPLLPPEEAGLLAGQPQQGSDAAGVTPSETPQNQSYGRPSFRYNNFQMGAQQMGVNRSLRQARGA